MFLSFSFSGIVTVFLSELSHLIWEWANIFNCRKKPNIVAAFRGMHVLPAKHSYAWLPRKCDYRTYTQTDRQTDAGQSDPYVPLRFAGDQKKKNSNNPVQTCYTFYFTSECRWGEVNWLFNVTINSTSVIYVTAHRCAGGLKKLDLRPGSQRHRLFVGFFKVPVQAWTLDQPFYTSIIPRNRSIWSPFTTR